MNKKLLALAIGAAVAMPATVLAAGPTLYGQIDLSAEYVNDNIGNDNDVSNSEDQWVIRSNASRLGVRGEVDTSVSGLKGIYQAEFGVDADDGDANNNWGNPGVLPFTSRDVFVGVAGDFGTVKIGMFDSPLKAAQGSVDQFNDTSLDMTKSGVVAENRLADVIQYSSPLLLDALRVNVAATTYSESSGTEPSMSTSVTYQTGGLSLALAMDSNVNDNTNGGLTIGSTIEVDTLRAVVGYKADALEVGFLYQTAEESFTGPGFHDEDTTMLLSGALTAGDWKFKAQFVQVDGDTTGNDPSVQTIAVGADYALGKSTTVYALAGQSENDNGAGTTNTYGTFGLGLRQQF